MRRQSGAREKNFIRDQKMKSRKEKSVPGIDGEEKQSSARACTSIGERVGLTERKQPQHAGPGLGSSVFCERKRRDPEPGDGPNPRQC